MSTEAERARKRRHWAKRMQDPEKRAAYLEYQRRYFQKTMADPAAREDYRLYTRAMRAKRKEENRK